MIFALAAFLVAWVVLALGISFLAALLVTWPLSRMRQQEAQTKDSDSPSEASAVAPVAVAKVAPVESPANVAPLPEMSADAISSVTGLAAETKLLALNVAFEAASAGEHGRGLGEVADEVQSLARRAKVTVEDSATLLETTSQKMAQSMDPIDV